MAVSLKENIVMLLNAIPPKDRIVGSPQQQKLAVSAHFPVRQAKLIQKCWSQNLKNNLNKLF
jgi:hypothetical protein